MLSSGIVTGSKTETSNSAKNRILKVKTGIVVKIENETKFRIKCGIKIRTENATEIGIRNSTEIKIKSGTAIENAIGISFDQEWNRNQKRVASESRVNEIDIESRTEIRIEKEIAISIL
ncbi:hypothetical protein EVAR_79048_1 [Eumeta japonica]|uniref:Uncharacterized protein n=1 Tax=Eumeta variegata TaxID=151549 RepID=A0A4C1XUI1_EUMVA|nr:hypothetical protein EVAR_79048_1 [Eumeta japonica]